MTFTSLTTNTQGYVTAIVFIAFIAMTLALIINFLAKSSNKWAFVLSFLLLVIIIDLTALIEYIDFSRPLGKTHFSPIAETINNIPYPIHIILGLVSIGISAYSIYKVYKADKDSINDFSIKEALESLPTGIAFVSKDNSIFLSNKIMHNLCKELTSKDLISGVDIWGELSSLRSSDKCVMNEDDPAFMLASGKVWQFSKIVQKHNNDNFIEIKATDITELYSLSENTKQFSEVLSKRQEKLKSLTNIIEQTTEKEITANMKVGFHDNFGNLLTLTKEMLRETRENSEIQDVAGHFAEIPNIITDITSERNQSLSLEYIISFGEKLGCEVIVNGDLPTDDENKTTILLCINEALKNAYCHANADKLNINITKTEDIVNVTIHNQIEHTLPKIIEGGGLTGLRQMIEKTGGKFNIKSEDGVIMEIQLGMIAVNY